MLHARPLTIRLAPGMRADLERLAVARELRVSDVVREACRGYLQTVQPAQFSARPPLQSPAPAADNQNQPCRSGGPAAGQVQELQP